MPLDLSPALQLVAKLNPAGLLQAAGAASELLVPAFRSRKVTAFAEVEGAVLQITTQIVQPVAAVLADGFQPSDLQVVYHLRGPIVAGISNLLGVLDVPDAGNRELELTILDPKNKDWRTFAPLSKRALLYMGARLVLEHWDPRVPEIKLPLWDVIDGGLEKKLTAAAQELLDELLYTGVPTALELAYSALVGHFPHLVGAKTSPN